MPIRSYSGSIFGLEQAEEEAPPIPAVVVDDQACPPGFVRRGDACYPPEQEPRSLLIYAAPLAVYFGVRMVAGTVTSLAAGALVWWLVNRGKGA